MGFLDVLGALSDFDEEEQLRRALTGGFAGGPGAGEYLNQGRLPASIGPVTPTFNPNAASGIGAPPVAPNPGPALPLPAATDPGPSLHPPGRPIPGLEAVGRDPIPQSAPEFRIDQILGQIAEGGDKQYLNLPGGGKGRLAGGALSALFGALQGLGATGSPWGALGGAIGHGALGAVDKGTANRLYYQAAVEPRLKQELGVQSTAADIARKRRHEQMQADEYQDRQDDRAYGRALKQHQIDLARQAQENPPPAPPPKAPTLSRVVTDADGRQIAVFSDGTAQPLAVNGQPVQAAPKPSAADKAKERLDGRNADRDRARLRAEDKDIAEAVGQFEKIKSASTAAGLDRDTSRAAALDTQMRAAAGSLKQRFGDRVEVGGTGPGETPWAKIRPRPPGAPPPQGGTASAAGRTNDLNQIAHRIAAENPGLSRKEVKRRALEAYNAQ